MLEIKFKGENKKELTFFRRLNEHVVIVGLDTNNTYGFNTYINGEEAGDFSDYTTIYYKEKQRATGIRDEKADLTYFSNDGSVYVEPKVMKNVYVYFDGQIDDSHEIPKEVTVATNVGSVIVTENNNWIGTVEAPESTEVEIQNATEIDGFDVEYFKNTVNYTSTAATWQEKIEAQVLYTAMMTDTIVEEDE